MKMLLLLVMLVTLAYSQGYRIGDFWVVSTQDSDDLCKYFVQVNEDGKVLITLEGRFDGWHGWYGGEIGIGWACYFDGSMETVEKAKRELDRRFVFKNSKDETCFFDGEIRAWATAGLFSNVYWFRGVGVEIICEEPPGNPDCGKSEKYARQVIMENHRAKCDSLGGNFEGDVYPHELPDESTMYCFSGSCDACETKWRDDLVNEWKEEVCCGERGKEPNGNNGICLSPGHSEPSKIGGSYSKITAFPGCSETPAGDGSYCEPPPSSSSAGDEPSSSSHEPESSSSNDWPYSSSEKQEDADCYLNDLEANAAYDGKVWKCIQAGNIPNFRLDSHRCIAGECMERSSSSEGASSSSSSSGGSGDSQCLASKPFLQKEAADIYDDWVYMGKESYGSKHTSRASFKPGTKFFDVLGRAYDKMKARIKYYVFKDAVKRDLHETQLEFEVWARIIKDSEGNDIQVFIKEDKRNGLRRDSSFYYDGYWEVFEFDDVANETRFKASSGIRSLRKYDDKKRLTERYMVDGNGDTLTSEKYEWKNGRLIRMTANGVVRNYIYGKTLRDTVKVEPSDEGFNYHSGYNRTVGKMPEEGTLKYEIFARSPYGHVSFGDEEEEYGGESSVAYFAVKNSVSENPGKPNALAKVTTSGCVVEESGMPKAQCIRYERNDIQNSAENRLIGFPRNGNSILYGHSDYMFSLNFKCECNAFGKYQPSFSGNTYNEKIEIYRSVWKYSYEEQYWHEHCWYSNDLQSTYYHEAKHIKNARMVKDNLVKTALTITYDTKEKCEKQTKEEQGRQEDKWDVWYDLEQIHENKNPQSPTKGGSRNGFLCN